MLLVSKVIPPTLLLVASPVIIRPVRVTFVAETSPTTTSAVVGFDVPIPTNPLERLITKGVALKEPASVYDTKLKSDPPFPLPVSAFATPIPQRIELLFRSVIKLFCPATPRLSTRGSPPETSRVAEGAIVPIPTFELEIVMRLEPALANPSIFAPTRYNPRETSDEKVYVGADTDPEPVKTLLFLRVTPPMELLVAEFDPIIAFVVVIVPLLRREMLELIKGRTYLRLATALMLPTLLPVQVIPSDEVASVFVPVPVATQRLPFHATPSPLVVKGEVCPVQVIPSDEVAIVFVPEPTATQRLPFHATAFPTVENVDVPRPVQVIPSDEVAIVCVPSPTATQRLPFHATL